MIKLETDNVCIHKYTPPNKSDIKIHNISAMNEHWMLTTIC